MSVPPLQSSSPVNKTPLVWQSAGCVGITCIFSQKTFLQRVYSFRWQVDHTLQTPTKPCISGNCIRIESDRAKKLTGQNRLESFTYEDHCRLDHDSPAHKARLECIDSSSANILKRWVGSDQKAYAKRLCL